MMSLKKYKKQGKEFKATRPNRRYCGTREPSSKPPKEYHVILQALSWLLWLGKFALWVCNGELAHWNAQLVQMGQIPHRSLFTYLKLQSLHPPWSYPSYLGSACQNKRVWEMFSEVRVCYLRGTDDSYFQMFLGPVALCLASLLKPSTEL